MTFSRSIARILPGFGSPIKNDTLFMSVNNALSGTVQAQISLTGLTPAITSGYVRVKLYQFGGTSPTLLSLIVNVDDGTSVVAIYINDPVVATVPGVSVTPGGVSLATNGAMATTNLKVVTSASNPFTPSQVGAAIAISKAGNAGQTLPLYSTVASYQSAGQITLSTSAAITSALASATITLLGNYANSGTSTAGSLSESGFDFVIPFMVDINVTEVDVNYTLGGTAPTAVMDVEVSGTVG
jgi:hypothetical protein